MVPTLRIPLMAALLLAAAMAGCIGNDEPGPGDSSAADADAGASVDKGQPVEAEPLYDSFDDAMAAPGQTFEPAEDSSVRLKLLAPMPTSGVPAEEVNVTFVLYDGSSPVEDANLTLDAIMVAMGHGTSPETDPAHDAHGVYVGSTNFVMDGTWRLDIGAATPSGDDLSWSISVNVGIDDGTDPNAQPVTRTFSDSFGDTVTEADYGTTWTFPVEAAGADIDVAISLVEPKALDELTFELLDPDGNVLTDATLTGSDAEGTLDVGSAPAAGDHTLRVTGRAVDTDYSIEVLVEWVEMVPPPETTSDEGAADDGHGHDH